MTTLKAGSRLKSAVCDTEVMVVRATADDVSLECGGAVMLALASEKKHWQCLGVDKFPEAVALAEKNRLHLRLINARFMQSDWFAALEPAHFDVIVSNPPYIDPQNPPQNWRCAIRPRPPETRGVLPGLGCQE